MDKYTPFVGTAMGSLIMADITRRMLGVEMTGDFWRWLVFVVVCMFLGAGLNSVWRQCKKYSSIPEGSHYKQTAK